jgi:hypothetical protein
MKKKTDLEQCSDVGPTSLKRPLLLLAVLLTLVLRVITANVDFLFFYEHAMF